MQATDTHAAIDAVWKIEAPKLIAALARMTRDVGLAEDLAKAGVLLSLDGLHPPSAGVRVSYKAGKPAVKDGPFAESKECVGGYWMIQVKSKEEAIEWAKRAPMDDDDIIEVRQVHEMSDFPPDVQAAASGFEELLGKK